MLLRETRNDGTCLKNYDTRKNQLQLKNCCLTMDHENQGCFHLIFLFMPLAGTWGVLVLFFNDK